MPPCQSAPNDVPCYPCRLTRPPLCWAQLAAIYFVTPTARSVQRIVDDFEGEKLMYRKAHVFFSNSARSARHPQSLGIGSDHPSLAQP